MAKLIVDNREAAMFSFLDAKCEGYQLQQLYVGDYLIVIDKLIVACIERKTWQDYAASICDGRMENKEKMKEFRTKTGGCRLIYVIEGAKPRGDHVHHVPVKSIQSSIRHLIAKDDIHVIYTASSADTAEQLALYLEDYNKMEITMPAELPEIVDGAAELTTIPQKTDVKIKTNMWQNLPGISRMIAPVLAQFSLADLIGNDMMLANEIKLPNGKKLTLPARESIGKLIDNDTETWTNFLAGVDGISKKTVSMILDLLADKNYNKIFFLDETYSTLSELKKDNRKILGKKANNIKDLFIIDNAEK